MDGCFRFAIAYSRDARFVNANGIIDSHSFDVLGAESMGQIGYVLAQALSSAGCTTAPIICQVVVDPAHEAFRDPSKFVGPIYGAKEATALSQSLGWVMKPDGEYFRRVVPSPPPQE